MPRPTAIGDRGMDASDVDTAAIPAVIRGETEAWLQRDFAAWARRWVQSPQARRMESWTALGFG
jgi:hypothetical protein